MKYRREIDGLRALAVLPVILFHAGFDLFSGGFVGVDVFFVISGYLITTILLNELENGQFSLLNFYERRARRILPALFFVMVACLPFAWLWLMPSDMKLFAQSLVAVTLFSSNILFWRKSGYFDPAADLNPLLHTWSLAVEEQYYLLFPLFLMLTWRYGRRWVLMSLVLTAVASLALAHWASAMKPVAGFYLLPTRGWELLIGAFIAFWQTSERGKRATVPALARELGGLAGIALLLYGIFAFDSGTPFPSLYALVPTIGTALIILFASPQTSVGKFLGTQPLVGIGLVSYSAYLWHQPLFAFARHRSLLEPGQGLLTALGALSLVLAFFSWKYVEAPFRNKQRFARGQIFGYSAAVSVVVASVGLTGHVSDGDAFRPHATALREWDERLRINHGLNSECEGTFKTTANCRTSEEPEVMLWGDSYAMHLAQALVASNPGIRLVQHTKSSCGPVLGIAPVGPGRPKKWAQDCIEFNNAAFEYLSHTSSIKYVVLSSPFGAYVGRKNTVLHHGDTVTLGDRVTYGALRSTLDKIRTLGKIPVIVSPPPTTGQDYGRCVQKAMMFGDPMTTCSVDYDEARTSQEDVLRLLGSIEPQYPVIWLHDYLCQTESCLSYAESKVIYRDSGHLSHEGSTWLGKKIGLYRSIVTAGANSGPPAEPLRAQASVIDTR